MQQPPVYLTDKTRELLRLLASDVVMAHALYAHASYGPSQAMLQVSTMDDEQWQRWEDKYRA